MNRHTLENFKLWWEIPRVDKHKITKLRGIPMRTKIKKFILKDRPLFDFAWQMFFFAWSVSWLTYSVEHKIWVSAAAQAFMGVVWLLVIWLHSRTQLLKTRVEMIDGFIQALERILKEMEKEAVNNKKQQDAKEA